MSFTNLGDYLLAAGQEMTIDLAFDPLNDDVSLGGLDMGAQWMMASPWENVHGPLLVKNHIKERVFRPLMPSGMKYSVTVVNVGGRSCRFSIQGGGNT
jgi:hypothetical protein